MYVCGCVCVCVFFFVFFVHRFVERVFLFEGKCFKGDAVWRELVKAGRGVEWTVALLE